MLQSWCLPSVSRARNGLSLDRKSPDSFACAPSGLRRNLQRRDTTCAVFINESQQALESDILAFLEDLAARAKYYKHNDPNHSDCDRHNADSHLRAMLLGHSVTMQISGGEVVIGQWQRVLCGEMDGPRTRTIRAQVMGLAAS